MSVVIEKSETLGTQLHVGRAIEPGRVEPVRNEGSKPRGGLWTSTLLGGEFSAWTEWCRSEEMPWLDRSWQRLEPLPGYLLLCIDSWNDLLEVLKRYRYRPEWRKNLTPMGPPYEGVDDRDEIDFEAIARDGFAGVHLTEMGNYECHFGLDRPLHADLYTWDCESTLWLRWCFKPLRVSEEAAR